MKKILQLLKKNYPKAKCSLSFKTPLEILVATILSAQCTDERVNKITKKLFQKYKTPEDYINTQNTELEKDIRSTGFFRNKAKNIHDACVMIEKTYNGKIPKTMKEIIKIPGVGRKTGNVVLQNAYGIIEGITVDTHVRRLSKRLGLTQQNVPEKIEHDLMKIVPLSDWEDISYMFIEHGRKICKALRPKCKECFLNKLCPSAFHFQ